jgi:hypothetical protein
MAAGENGIPAMRGVGRLWDIKQRGFHIEQERIENSRLWKYQLVTDEPKKETPKQQSLFVVTRRSEEG